MLSRMHSLVYRVGMLVRLLRAKARELMARIEDAKRWRKFVEVIRPVSLV